MDTIFINELRLDIRVGVYEWEAQVAQKVQFDLEFALPDAKAAQSGQLADTIDYAAVVGRIEHSLAGHHFGLLLTQAAGIGDIRKIGSGNIGATNVLRTGNKGLAAATLILDMLKGTAAVLIAGFHGTEYAIAAGLGAFLGHLFPVWLGFKGGKGVATYIGVLAGLMWQAALLFGAVWIVVTTAVVFAVPRSPRTSTPPISISKSRW